MNNLISYRQTWILVACNDQCISSKDALVLEAVQVLVGEVKLWVVQV